MTDINETLAQREQTHGSFITHADISQRLKAVMYEYSDFKYLASDQKEALEMIAHKIARILNGNPDVHDHWHDIAGYATLVANRLK
jgi:fido (protein-threonine AMPylation protein)